MTQEQADKFAARLKAAVTASILRISNELKIKTNISSGQTRIDLFSRNIEFAFTVVAEEEDKS